MDSKATSFTPGVPILSLLLLVTASGCGGKASGQTEGDQEHDVPVRVQEIVTGDLADVLTYGVDVQPEMEIRIYSMLSETILEFPWEDGDEIEAGQRVALIRTKGLKASIAQISAQVEGVDVQIKQAQDSMDRTKKLLDTGVMSKTEYDNVESGYLSLMAQKKALTAGKGQVADTKSKGSIKAPISGVIADKSVEAGDMASPVMPLCRILGVSKLLAILDLAEQDVPRVHVGQEVILQMDAWPDSTFKGVVARILPYLDASTRTNAVEVLVDNPIDPATQKRFLKPGMYGTAQLVVEKRIGVVVVPGYGLLMDTELLDQQQGSELIRKAFVVDKSSVAHERIVKLGIRQGTLWEIVSGLEAGDLLVIRGQHGLVDGQKVEVVD